MMLHQKIDVSICKFLKINVVLNNYKKIKMK